MFFKKILCIAFCSIFSNLQFHVDPYSSSGFLSLSWIVHLISSLQALWLDLVPQTCST